MSTENQQNNEQNVNQVKKEIIKALKKIDKKISINEMITALVEYAFELNGVLVLAKIIEMGEKDTKKSGQNIVK